MDNYISSTIIIIEQFKKIYAQSHKIIQIALSIRFSVNKWNSKNMMVTIFAFHWSSVLASRWNKFLSYFIHGLCLDQKGNFRFIPEFLSSIAIGPVNNSIGGYFWLVDWFAVANLLNLSTI